MSRLTILIPSRDVNDCEELLVSVLQNRPRATDVVVVHSLPYEDPYDLRAEVEFLHLPGNPSQTCRINAGLRASRGEIVHLLAPGMRVTEGWIDAVLPWFDQPATAAVSPLIVSAEDASQLTAGVGYRSGGTRLVRGQLSETRAGVRRGVLGPTLRAGFFRRQAVLELGGFCESVGDHFADVDLALSLAEAGWQAVVEPHCRIEEITAASSTLESAFMTGRQAERLFWRHAKYNGWLGSLVQHPFILAGELLAAGGRWSLFSQLFGRLFALAELGLSARHIRQIEAVRETRQEPDSGPAILPFPRGQAALRTAHRRAA